MLKMDKLLQEDEEMVQNLLTRKKEFAKKVAPLNEADQVLLAEFTDKFLNNIELARKKGVLFFDKLL